MNIRNYVHLYEHLIYIDLSIFLKYTFSVLDKCPGGWVFIVMCFLCRIMEGIGQTAFCNAHYVIIMSKFPERKGTMAVR